MADHSARFTSQPTNEGPFWRPDRGPRVLVRLHGATAGIIGPCRVLLIRVVHLGVTRMRPPASPPPSSPRADGEHQVLAEYLTRQLPVALFAHASPADDALASAYNGPLLGERDTIARRSAAIKFELDSESSENSIERERERRLKERVRFEVARRLNDCLTKNTTGNIVY